MARTTVTSEADARAQIGPGRTMPDWREGRHNLPFHELSDDEFEVFSFLLLKREHPRDDVRYYGGTGDGGRDVIHRRTTTSGTIVRLIQCKRYGSNVTLPVVRRDMAKVWVNVYSGAIPERPDELVFYVAPDLSNPAKNLIDSQERWRQEAGTALQDHVGTPVPDELARHAAEWWPSPTYEAALSLTERVRKHPALIEEFFGTRKVIDGGVAEVSNAVCERVLPRVESLLPRVESLAEQLGRVERAVAAVHSPAPATAEDIKAAFVHCSTGLLRWQTTVSSDRWLDRPELLTLVERVSRAHGGDGTVTVVLGPPGSGKSALLARLGQQLIAGGTTVLAVKADQLRYAVDTAAKLAEALGLPVLTEQAVGVIAAAEPVVVLLDQLDALADLADLRSERLHVLLTLIDRLAGRPGVHVVCSCREFEFQHDGRLSRIDADAVRLQPPAWEQVAAVLDAHGVSATGWPDDAKALLRTPHHLAVFLSRLQGPGEHQVFTTYQQLFNSLWREEVVRRGGGRADLLHDLADELAAREELWLDRGRFDSRLDTVEGLIAAGVLTLTDDGFRVGFRHQSLFEFTRAKSFARGGVSLADYVLARQHALFVRPTLWMTLNYLRLADPTAYAREFGALWVRADLRRHVKHLLIDFLSQVEQPEPADWEQARLVEALRDASWRRKVLTAVTGKGGWFRLFAGSILPAEMRLGHDQAWDVIWVLVSALGIDRDRCLDLMREHWRPDKHKLPLVWQTLTYLAEWDERATDLAVAVVRDSSVEHGGMWHLAQTIAKSTPTQAIRLVAEWLNAARHRVVPGTDEAEAAADRLVRILTNHNHWHGVEELAAQAPVEFARNLWPAVYGIITRSPGYSSDYVVRYADDRIAFARVDRREYVAFDSPDEFFLAYDSSFRVFARTCPSEFLAIVAEVSAANSRVLQRLLCRGVRELTPEYPAEALAFLTADPRRLWLGGRYDDHGDSIELLTTLAPHLTDDQLAGLTAVIRTWEMYRNREDEEREPNNIYARGHRFRLLSVLPLDRIPEDVRRELDAERTALPEYVRTAHSECGTGLRLIGSPVSRDELAGRTDTDIAGLFDQFPDSTESRHPKDWMTGGSVQLSREFEEFVKAHPDRTGSVVAQLRPGTQERPAAHAVSGLVAARRPVAEVVALIEQLDERGFSGEEFRSTVAFALDDLARAGGLPDGACELLDRWRIADWSNNDRDEPERDNQEDSSQPTSILWRYGGTVTLPHGRFPVLSALTRAYLCRAPHAADRWLMMLRDHVERQESVTNWRAMTLYLADLWCCPDREGAREFLVRLLTRFPAVFLSDLGVRFLARVAELFPDESRRCAYGVVRSWGPERGPQAFGELVCLRHLLHPKDGWACDRVEEALAGAQEGDSEWVAVGVAFAAGHLWPEPECRTRATDLLCRLVACPSERVGNAVMSVYQTRNDLPLDDMTLRLFRTVGAHPDILQRSCVDESFFDHLLDTFLVDPELVCRVSEEAVCRRGAELQSAGRRFYMAGSVLIDTSLRLQRSGGDFRKRGMDLFEALLDLGVSEAVGVARSNDLRLAPGVGPLRMPRRRRSRTPPQDEV